jgi:hypothetical protein
MVCLDFGQFTHGWAGDASERDSAARSDLKSAPYG